MSTRSRWPVAIGIGLLTLTTGVAGATMATTAMRDVAVSTGTIDAPWAADCASHAPSATVEWASDDPFATFEIERADARVATSWSGAAAGAAPPFTDTVRGLWQYRVRSARGASWRSAWSEAAGPCQVLASASLSDAETVIVGAAAEDQIAVDQGSFSAGDFNGDGREDVIIGAHLSDPNGSASGTAYVVFGNGTRDPIDLADLGTRGIRLMGAVTNTWAGRRVAAAGDVNGDGFDDVVVGAESANANGTNAGAAFVVFGTTNPTDITLNNALGSTGFRIAGPEAGARVGQVVGAGDVNGDGYDDVVVGSHLADANGVDSGAAYVVYGSAAPSNVVLSATMGSAGFRIAGPHPGATAGFAVAAGADVDGDGRNDLAIGAPYANANGAASGAVYVVFGTADATNVVLADNMGAPGFRIGGPTAGAQIGRAVVLADFDGDDHADVAVDASLDDAAANDAGAVYVVRGKIDPTDLTLSSEMGGRGYWIRGAAAGDLTGRHLGLAGDHDGDGIVDLAIGTYLADVDGVDAGAMHVVLGAPGASDLELAGDLGARAVRYAGAAAGDRAGRSVGSVDADGDGRVDLLVAAPNADPQGRTDAGVVHVLLGTQLLGP